MQKPAAYRDEVPLPIAPRKSLKQLFAKTSDPYAGADLPRAKRLGGVLWLVGALSSAALLPLAPPVAISGGAGWACAAAVIGCSTLAALRLLLQGPRVGVDEMLLLSYAGLLGIAALEWLAGGRATPYHQLYLVSVIYAAMVHPPRRVLPFFGALTLAMSSTALGGGWTAAAAGDAAMQLFLSLGAGFAGLALMTSVRAQRVSLQEEGDHARDLATRDPLTHIGNRRALMQALDGLLADDGRRAVLALFDLDGFKSYNDSFGHPAGDALLIRLAGNLESSVAGRGRAFRMGGDEFCVLVDADGCDPAEVARLGALALSEAGEGFAVTASCGHVLIPAEADDAIEALRVADQRMYAEKTRSRASAAGRQTTDVLLQVLAERDPGLGVHVDGVTGLCEGVARSLALPEDERAALLQAAALHDVGKAAIPDAILEKPGPLDDEEWEFMRRHTVIGERILAVAPSLAAAASYVRSSHERFDGRGYPDGLAGEQIPLAARIISVCDAFDAMTSDRPYRNAKSAEVALEELRRCSGHQFDPVVVEAFARELVPPRERGQRVTARR